MRISVTSPPQRACATATLGLRQGQIVVCNAAARIVLESTPGLVESEAQAVVSRHDVVGYCRELMIHCNRKV